MIRRKTDPAMKRVHLHNPVEIEFNHSIKYAIAENGQVTITVLQENEEFDEVVVPAYLIFHIGQMLNQTRKGIKNVPREPATTNKE